MPRIARSRRRLPATTLALAGLLSWGVAACGGSGAPADGSATATTTDWTSPFLWTASDVVPCPPVMAADDALGSLAAQLGLAAEFGLDPSVVAAYGGRLAEDPARLAVVERLKEYPSEAPCFAGNRAIESDQAVASAHPLTRLAADRATMLGYAVGVGGGFPAIDAQEPLMAELRKLNAGGAWDEAAAIAAAADVPLPVQVVAARILRAVPEAASQRDDALDTWSSSNDKAELFDKATRLGSVGDNLMGDVLDKNDETDQRYFENGSVASRRLFEGGLRLLQAIDEAGLDTAATSAVFSFVAPTPFGAVVIKGGGDDTYDPATDATLAGALLLVLDTGGNDTVRSGAGANTSADNPIAIHIDLGGDDTYTYTPRAGVAAIPGLLPADAAGRFTGNQYVGPISFSAVARQGAGTLGYGILVDRGGGNDAYSSLRHCQGSARLGLGLLADDGGDDLYTAESGAQGSAQLGLGILLDGGGNDRYRAFYGAQGFGGTSASGLLYDAGGDDQYELVPTDPILMHWPDDPVAENLSFGQGGARGARDDATGLHLSGGVGLLRDLDGDDTYRAGIFAQGAGYWFGMGILADAAGNDSYDAMKYAQAAGVHLAVGILLEGDGNDRYNADIQNLWSSLGHGHDRSIGYLVDDAGDDQYAGATHGIGSSKCFAIGMLVDNGGDDNVVGTHAQTIGSATSFDQKPGDCGTSSEENVAIFLNIGGVDTYVRADAAGPADAATWETVDAADKQTISAIGADFATGRSYARAYGAAWRRDP